jgi:L-threonylcarbamoyladenylate synthase
VAARVVPVSGETIVQAGDLLRAGVLVAFPTETVYGLGADATHGRAVAAIFATKGRPRFNPLIVHVPDVAAAERLAVLGETARRLAEVFWPGPLTLVLTRRTDSGLSDLVTAGLDTVAIRVPGYPVAQALLRAAGVPVAAPSANRSGHVSATTAQHVAADFDAGATAACLPPPCGEGSGVGVNGEPRSGGVSARFDHAASTPTESVAPHPRTLPARGREALGPPVEIVILDGGPTPQGLESTVVDATGGEVVLLRPGTVPAEAIEAVLGRPLRRQTQGGDRPLSPGQLASHYAPRARVRLNATDVRLGEALLAFGAHAPATRGPVVNLSPSGDLIEAAANLFAALRALDTTGATTIAVMPIPEHGLGEAIVDRLRRAAAGR